MARGYPSVKVLCVDEIAPRKGRKNYQLVISAPELGVVLDLLPNRLKETLEAWFEARGSAWCAHVDVFNADMWRPYHDVAAEQLPNAQLVVDRFHLMKNLNDALTKSRRAIQREADEATKDILKGCRWLLVKNRENLTAEQLLTLDEMLNASQELRTCYQLKESFRQWFESLLTPQEARPLLEQLFTII